MKRVITLILALVMCLPLVACGDNTTNDDNSKGQPQESNTATLEANTNEETQSTEKQYFEEQEKIPVPDQWVNSISLNEENTDKSENTYVYKLGNGSDAEEAESAFQAYLLILMGQENVTVTNGTTSKTFEIIDEESSNVIGFLAYGYDLDVGWYMMIVLC